MNGNKVQHCIGHFDLDGSKVSDKQLLSETFKNFFVERSNNIHTNIPNAANQFHIWYIPMLQLCHYFMQQWKKSCQL